MNTHKDIRKNGEQGESDAGEVSATQPNKDIYIIEVETFEAIIRIGYAITKPLTAPQYCEIFGKSRIHRRYKRCTDVILWGTTEEVVTFIKTRARSVKCVLIRMTGRRRKEKRLTFAN